jgi:hypothetical protein
LECKNYIRLHIKGGRPTLVKGIDFWELHYWEFRFLPFVLVAWVVYFIVRVRLRYNTTRGLPPRKRGRQGTTRRHVQIRPPGHNSKPLDPLPVEAIEDRATAPQPTTLCWGCGRSVLALVLNRRRHDLGVITGWQGATTAAPPHPRSCAAQAPTPHPPPLPAWARPRSAPPATWARPRPTPPHARAEQARAEGVVAT